MKIKIPKNQKNPKYKEFWDEVEKRSTNALKTTTQINYNETEITMIIVLLSRCKDMQDFENLRARIYAIAQRMDFYGKK
jgi:hypothetical protein